MWIPNLALVKSYLKDCSQAGLVRLWELWISALCNKNCHEICWTQRGGNGIGACKLMKVDLIWIWGDLKQDDFSLVRTPQIWHTPMRSRSILQHFGSSKMIWPVPSTRGLPHPTPFHGTAPSYLSPSHGVPISCPFPTCNTPSCHGTSPMAHYPSPSPLPVVRHSPLVPHPQCSNLLPVAHQPPPNFPSPTSLCPQLTSPYLLASHLQLTSPARS